MNPITEKKIANLDVAAAFASYKEHLENIVTIFNEHAMELGLGVSLDAEGAISSAKSNIARVARFADRTDDSGVLHDSQLMTALDCVGELLTAPQNNGLVLGAMQSGKTTTSLALQFAGPIVYLLTGRCLYPIYLITSHTSQEDQTKIEISRFLDYYGELKVEINTQSSCKLIDYVKHVGIDPFFTFSPTIDTYREHVLKKALPDTMMGPRLDDFIQRRTNGEAIARVASLCRRANSKGYAPLLIIDEPQFGASDRFVRINDELERRSCVLLKIFNAIDEALGADKGDRVFIGLSATPYELHDIEAVWEVKQYLTTKYRGFNYFGGDVIDANADVEPPRTMDFKTLADEFGIPFLKNVSLQAYDASPTKFDRFARSIGYVDGQEHYRRDVERVLSAAILDMTGTDGDATGVCMRLFNNNARSHLLLQNLELPSEKIEVIEYFGAEYRGQSVKRAIRQRKNKERPFLIAVTSRARMGDAFPNQVKWFLEFSKKASDLNALLQGLLGRACGYGKDSTVVLSSENAALVDDYKSKQGAYIYKTSRHSQVVGTYRRGAPTTLIKVYREMDDSLVKEFFERVDSEVVAPYVIQNQPALNAKRSSQGRPFRTAPLIKIAEEMKLFDHLERPDIREKLFPSYPEFKVTRLHDEIENPRSPGGTLKYTVTEDGENRFTFRELAGDGSSHAGVRSRGYGARDASDREAAGDTLEPQVNMRKYDSITGEFIDDKRLDGVPLRKHERRAGYWRAEMVTLPLVKPVRELQAGEATFPVAHSPFAELLSTEERTLASHN